MTIKIEIYAEEASWDTLVTEVQGKRTYLVESSLEGFAVEGFTEEGRQLVNITGLPAEINFAITGVYYLDEDVTESWNHYVTKSYFGWKNICCDCGKFGSFPASDKRCNCCPGRGCGNCNSCMNPGGSLTRTLEEAIDLYEDLCK